MKEYKYLMDLDEPQSVLSCYSIILAMEINFPLTQAKLIYEYVIYFQERFLKVKWLKVHSSICSLIFLIKIQIYVYYSHYL